MLIFLLAYGTFKGYIRKAVVSHPPTVKVRTEPSGLPINPIVRENARNHHDKTPGENGREANYGLHGSDTLIGDFQAFPYTGWYPPDPQIGVGPSHVVVVVNGGVRVFDRSGSVLYDNTLAGFFSPIYPGYGNVFDPKVAYDPLARRWYILAVYVSYSPDSAFYYLAVSQTPNPLGGWYYYALDATLDGSTPTSNLADYPGLGYNDKWIVLTSNQFTFSWSYQYGKVRVLDKAAALSGTLSGWTDFYGSDLGSYTYTIKPARSLSTSPTAFLVKRRYNDRITFFKISGPSTSPTLSLITSKYITVFSTTDSVPQMGTSTKLEAGDFAGILGATYYNGKVFLTFGESHILDPALSSSRLIVLDTTPNVLEDIPLYEDGYSWIYPYVGVSPKGLVVVFTRVGPTSYPSVYYVSRPSGDSLFSPPRPLKEGLTWYVRVYNSRNRWGDYFGAAMDPVDSTVWIVGEYSVTNDTWGVWVGRVRFLSAVKVVERLPVPLLTEGETYDLAGRRVREITHPGVYFVKEGKTVRKVLVVRP